MFKAYNKITGLWYLKGRGFVVLSRRNASTLDAVESKAVKYTFDNTIVVAIGE